MARVGIGPDQLRVSSAGVRAYDGWEMDERAADVLTGRGIAGAELFRSRGLDRAHIVAADLVLTAERAHRDAVVARVPAAARTTYTLREFALLLDDVDEELAGVGVGVAERARALVAAAAEQRGGRRLPLDLDLPDPVAGDPAGFQACAAEIDRLISGFLTRLAPVRPGSAR